MTISKSNYISASGHHVDLYKNEKTGEMFTVVDGEITLYGSNGDMLCSARSIQDALEIIGG